MEAKGLRKTKETKKEPEEDKAQTLESGWGGFGLKGFRLVSRWESSSISASLSF